MKRIYLLFILILFGLSACNNPKEADIVTTMFVQYDIASQIVKEKMSVSMIIAAGAEVHGYEPSPRDIEAIKKSKLFIYTSLKIDDWIKDPNIFNGDNTKVMDLSKSYQYEEDHHHDEELNYKGENINQKKIENDEHDHEHDELHYWTDPLIVLELIESILEEIIIIDPINEDYYRVNAKEYYDKIDTLHHELEDFLIPNHLGTSIYFAGHNALGGFSKRYDINIVALSNTSKPDADLTSFQIETLMKEIENNNARFLFIEELKEPKVANTIKRELAKKNYEIEILLLHGYHNVSKEEFDAKISYADLFRDNIINLKLALGEN